MEGNNHYVFEREIQSLSFSHFHPYQVMLKGFMAGFLDFSFDLFSFVLGR